MLRIPLALLVAIAVPLAIVRVPVAVHSENCAPRRPRHCLSYPRKWLYLIRDFEVL